MKEVYILFSVANDYNQPNKAFEKIFWRKPSLHDLSEYGFRAEHMKNLSKPNLYGEGRHWVEKFKQPTH